MKPTPIYAPSLLPIDSGAVLKRRLKTLLRLAALLCGTAAALAVHAEPVSIPVTGEDWSLTFESPALTEKPLPFRPRGFAYFANAGRLNVSLYVETPACIGGEDNAARYACFRKSLARNPMVLPDSVGASPAPLGLMAVYGASTEVRGQVFKMLNIHLLFYHRGKEVDFHVSMVQPDAKDVVDLNALVQSVKVVEK